MNPPTFHADATGLHVTVTRERHDLLPVMRVYGVDGKGLAEVSLTHDAVKALVRQLAVVL